MDGNFSSKPLKILLPAEFKPVWIPCNIGQINLITLWCHLSNEMLLHARSCEEQSFVTRKFFMLPHIFRSALWSWYFSISRVICSKIVFLFETGLIFSYKDLLTPSHFSIPLLVGSWATLASKEQFLEYPISLLLWSFIGHRLNYLILSHYTMGILFGQRTFPSGSQYLEEYQYPRNKEGDLKILLKLE